MNKTMHTVCHLLNPHKVTHATESLPHPTPATTPPKEPYTVDPNKVAPITQQYDPDSSSALPRAPTSREERDERDAESSPNA